MGAAALGEDGLHHLDRVAPLARIGAFLRRLHLADVVRVGHAHVADAAEDVARHVAVAAGGLAGQVGFHAAQPLLGLGLAVVRDQRGDERGVVGVLAGTDADLALPLGIGQVFVAEGAQLQVLVGIQHPGPHRQPEPVALRAAQVGRDRLLQRGRLHRLGDAALDQVEQVAHVHRHQHVGRRAGTFGAHPLQQAVLHEHGVDLHPALRAEGGQQRLHQRRLPRGVERDRFGGECRSGRGGCQGNGAEAQGRAMQRAGRAGEACHERSFSKKRWRMRGDKAVRFWGKACCSTRMDANDYRVRGVRWSRFTAPAWVYGGGAFEPQGVVRR